MRTRLTIHCPICVIDLSGERRLEIEKEYAAVKARFIDRNGRPQGSWSKQKIFQMAVDVGLGDHYPTFYSWASSMHHIDIGGLASQSEGNDVNVAPSLEWIDIALIAGHSAALIVLEEFNGVAALGFDEEIQSAIVRQHGLADVDQLGRAFADDVHAQQPARIDGEDHLHHAGVQTHDVTA